MEKGKVHLREEDFVFNIVQDPANPPDTLLLVGFIGRSAIEGHTRVYLDVLLGAYVDVPETAILHAQAVASSQSPLGGWYVWLKRDLDLLDRVRDAYGKLRQLQQDYMQELQPDNLGFGDITPGWPQMPT